MSTMIDYRDQETDGPDYEPEYHEDVLIAEVTHACCGRTQGYYNCHVEAVPGPEAICRDCQPRVEEDDDFTDPFAE